jgi:hypothetical protein
MKTLINKIVENRGVVFQGICCGLFVSFGIVNVVVGIFSTKDSWQINCGVNQIIIAALIYKA